MRAVICRAFGNAEKQLVLGQVAKPVLVRSGEVLLKVRAAGVNRADILQRQGKYPPPKGCSELLGLEVAGEVVESQSTRWQPGDRAMALLPGGGYGEFCAADEETLMPVPQGMEFLVAAGIPEVYLTAYQLLRFVASAPLAHEDSPPRNVLIHAGASGVGTAAIQLAATVFKCDQIIATASSEDKLALCRELGATDAFSYTVPEPPWHKLVLEATAGRGVDVVLDPVAGPSHMPMSLKCCADDAAYVLFAAMGGMRLKDFSLAPFLLKRVRLLPSTLRGRSLEYKKRLVDEFSAEVLPHFPGKLEPVLDHVFSLDNAREAHERMEANLNMGKIILTFD